jgi:predicted PurR-regulated permease PerM
VIDKEFKLPFYLKTTVILVGLFAFFTIMDIGQSIIVPVVFALIFAILLHPVVNFFIKLKIHRVIAITLALFLTLIIIFALGGFLLSQVNRFSESWPLLVDKFTLIINQSITSASDLLGVDPKNMHDWIIKTKGELINGSSAAIGKTIIVFGNGIVVLLLIPTYVFIILYYQPLLIEFIRRLFTTGNHSQVRGVITQIKTLIQRYLVGLIIEGIIVAMMNTTALLLLGVDYAIVLGVIGALLNVIPYIGGIVAVALPMMVALATKSSEWYALYVLIAYYIIQLIDNNYIVTFIVASKVKINALFSIIVVFVGNALWGIPGMFLSIPLLAIVKLICDNVESLKPWGYLLGDTMPPLIKLKKLKEII